MFTGLIQAVGTMLAIENKGRETRLRIATDTRMRQFIPGESIAVNGVCLTVEIFSTDWFSVYASAETMSRTNLGGLQVGSLVNLERALALGDRLGGHLVSGHVDCVATVKQINPAGESRIFTLEFDPEHSPLVIPKGSVALDGISLTVNDCGKGFLTVNIIPATQKETTIGKWQPGTAVNMETDIIGKYVRSMTASWTGTDEHEDSSRISMEFLRQNGF
ncbi:riboflavin synthase [Desulfoplanes formicivorans]|uniref:Riboflavin synthase n=1 Tax=Desulfoplanes formicivorans TaxID=1592317 RepID=A0A194AEY1_9BACT|nr:riboflavin synthase [Desulfoplanes formicivorans]GAU07888.1 riboflavin synthase subunit alpha [Desulfoplanes formicivorans]